MNKGNFRSFQSGMATDLMIGMLLLALVGNAGGWSKPASKYLPYLFKGSKQVVIETTEKSNVAKTIEQISQISRNIRALFSSQQNYRSLNYIVIKKALLAPEAMWNADKTGLKNLFGGNVLIYHSDKMSGDGKAFVISADNIPQLECIELLTAKNDFKDLIALGTGDVDSVYYGCTDSGNSVYCITKGMISADTAEKMCSATSNVIRWKFY